MKKAMEPDSAPAAQLLYGAAVAHWWRHVDHVGTAASSLCAVHCLAMPLVWGVLPLLGLGFLGNHSIERGFVAFASVLALLSLSRGYRLHHRGGALLQTGLGIFLLVLGVTWGEHLPLLWHSLMEASGGTLIAIAHYRNLRWLRVESPGALVAAEAAEPAA